MVDEEVTYNEKHEFYPLIKNTNNNDDEALPYFVDVAAIDAERHSAEYNERLKNLSELMDHDDFQWYSHEDAWVLQPRNSGSYTGYSCIYKFLTNRSTKGMLFIHHLVDDHLAAILEEDVRLCLSSPLWESPDKAYLPPWKWCGHISSFRNQEIRLDR